MGDLVRRLLATVGGLVGLRSTESDVTVTVEGKWAGRFDPVRLSLAILVVGMVIVVALCTAFTWDAGDLVREGPYQVP